METGKAERRGTACRARDPRRRGGSRTGDESWIDNPDTPDVGAALLAQGGWGDRDTGLEAAC
jgi:hypothetical protein